jgi:hypothetical protein
LHVILYLGGAAALPAGSSWIMTGATPPLGPNSDTDNDSTPPLR